jgi:ATP synthase protein I
MRYTLAPLLGAKKADRMLRHLSKPVGAVLRWQVLAMAVMTLAAAALTGWQGAISALLGGLVSIAAGLASAFVASRGNARSAGGVLASALRAEAVKLGLALLLLWLVLANYREAVVVVLLATFVVTMLIFAMAFFVRDY